MNSRIIGNQNALNRAANVKPGDKTALVNFELINELPEEFEPVLVEVHFKFPDDFSDVGNGHYMPSTDLMYKIAEAKGISSSRDSSTVEPIYQEVDIAEMNRSDVPNFQRIKVGYSVTKISTVMQEDGTVRSSSPCTIHYNAWDRCCELWSKEEMYTDGYQKPNKYPNKYDTKFKRKAHFYSEMKFAQQKAETKAYLKTVRELASLMTGFEQKDISSGSFMFAKIRRSAAAIKMETAARLTAISSGKDTYDASELFGSPQPKNIGAEPNGMDITPEPAPEPEPEPQIDTAVELLAAFSFYRQNKVVPEEMDEDVANVLSWLEDASQDHTNERFLEKAVSMLKTLEAQIPAMMRKEHSIYEQN